MEQMTVKHRIYYVFYLLIFQYITQRMISAIISYITINDLLVLCNNIRFPGSFIGVAFEMLFLPPVFLSVVLSDAGGCLRLPTRSKLHVIMSKNYWPSETEKRNLTQSAYFLYYYTTILVIMDTIVIADI